MEQAPASTMRQRVPRCAFKWIKRFALCLLLGAVVNVGVAWGLLRFGSGIVAGDRWSRVSHWPIQVPDTWPSPDVLLKSQDGAVREYRYIASDPANPIGDRFETDFERTHTVWIIESGWPMRSLRQWMKLWAVGDATPPRDFELTLHYSIETTALNAWIDRYIHVSGSWPLPWMPMVLGFATNTLFYGAVLFVPLFGVGVLKRRRRMKRGLCVRCAYDITGLSVCPECGQERKASGSRQQATGNPEKGAE